VFVRHGPCHNTTHWVFELLATPKGINEDLQAREGGPREWQATGAKQKKWWYSWTSTRVPHMFIKINLNGLG
jgi:hypothetical protein